MTTKQILFVVFMYTSGIFNLLGFYWAMQQIGIVPITLSDAAAKEIYEQYLEANMKPLQDQARVIQKQYNSKR